MSPSPKAVLQMRPGAPSLCCWLWEVGLQQPLWAQSSHLQILWGFLFQGQIFLPSLGHTDYGFTLDEPLCWCHWKQLSQWGSICCQKMKEREYKLASLIWAGNWFFFFFLFLLLGRLMHFIWFRLIKVFTELNSGAFHISALFFLRFLF